MIDDPHIEHVRLPPVQGIPGLAQGVYGDAGNLELVAPGEDGLWVFWFNADPVDHRQGAVRDRWSGGLNFARDHVFRAATMTQLTAGPNFLEVLAVHADEASVRRLYWTPADGFVDAGIVATGVGATPVREDGPTAFFTVSTEDGGGRLFAADLADYPQVTWRDVGATDPVSDPVAAELIQRWPDQDFAAAGVAATLLDDGRLDAVLRSGDRLWHSWSTDLTGDEWNEPVLIESVVWRRAADGPVHRVS